METVNHANIESFKVTENWESQAKALKHRFSILTDADLKFEEGKDAELLGRIATRLGKTKEEMIGIINSPVSSSKL